MALVATTATISGTPARAQTGATCTATYTIFNQWTDGYQADVWVYNNSAVPLDAWTVLMLLDDDQTESYIWNAYADPLAYAPHTILLVTYNASFNGHVEPGQGVGFAFVGTKPPGQPATPPTRLLVCGGG